MEDTKEKIITSFAMLFMLTIIGKIFGFAEKQILAYYFGTSWQVDVYFVVLNLSLVFFVFCEELIQPTFLPIFLEFKRETNKKAMLFFNALLFVLIMVLTLLVIINTTFSKFIIQLFAPGFIGPKLALASQLLRIMSFSILLQGISVLFYCFLNSFKIFSVPALAQTIYKLMSAIGMIVFIKLLGVNGLAVSILLAAFIKMVIMIAGIIAKRLWQPTMLYFRNVGIKQLLFLMLPLIIGTLFSQMSGRIDDYFASQLPDGQLAALNYAKKLVDLPLLVIPYCLGIVIFPYLSELAVRLQENAAREEFYNLFIKWSQITLYIFLLIEIFSLAMAVPLVRLVFEHGAFGSQSTLLTSQAFYCYSLGVVAFAMEIIIMQIFFSMQDTMTPIIVGVVCVFVNIILTITLLPFLQHQAIAIAYTFQKTLKILVLLMLINKKLKFMELRSTFVYVKKLVLPITTSAAVLFIIQRGMDIVFESHWLPIEVFKIGISASAFMFVAFWIAIKSKVSYIDELYTSIESKTRKLLKS